MKCVIGVNDSSVLKWDLQHFTSISSPTRYLIHLYPTRRLKTGPQEVNDATSSCLHYHPKWEWYHQVIKSSVAFYLDLLIVPHSPTQAPGDKYTTGRELALIYHRHDGVLESNTNLEALKEQSLLVISVWNRGPSHWWRSGWWCWSLSPSLTYDNYVCSYRHWPHHTTPVCILEK